LSISIRTSAIHRALIRHFSFRRAPDIVPPPARRHAVPDSAESNGITLRLAIVGRDTGIEGRILIIAGDDRLARWLRHGLASHGYDVEVAASGRAGLATVLAWRPHAIVLDVRLPDIDAFELCRDLAGRAAVPLVVLTQGIEASINELAALLRLVLKRGNLPATGAGMVRFADVVIDLDHARVERAGVQVPFTQKELELLRFLITHPASVFTRDELLQMVWGFHDAPLTRTVDTHVARLRQKLEADPHNPRYIQTIYGTGYAFMP
jgi:DNA-binding response OmpR family regulator